MIKTLALTIQTNNDQLIAYQHYVLSLYGSVVWR